ncbi:MAG: 50S ribosomal protein L6 [Chitinispirillia bacterium]
MSRIGKKPIEIPDGVEVIQSEFDITLKGPKGSLTQKISKDIIVTYDKKNKRILFDPKSNNKRLRALWGLYRMLVYNMVKGVSAGFEKTLAIVGVGYKAEMRGSMLQISVGYSHPVLFMPPEGITLGVDGPLKIKVSGIDKQKVGQIAAEIRSIRPPEPYKGKGIQYENEHIIRKAGKTGAK